jgi:hypothetical protein
MCVDHEGVEVDAPLPRGRQGVEKQIHQQGLSSADVTPQIKTARRLGKEPESAADAITVEGGRKGSQAARSGLLRRIGSQLTASDGAVVTRK